MFTSLKVNNFRCFQSFELQELGRINLLVGANNSGKTSLLEAIQLLCSGGNLNSLQELMIPRGEYERNKSARRRELERELDISNLFYGYEIETKTQLKIEAANEKTKENLTLSVLESESNFDLSEEFDDNSIELGRLDLFLHFTGQKEEKFKVPLSTAGGLSTDYLRRRRTNGKAGIKTQFVTPLSLNISQLTSLFDKIVLTPEENLVLEALQIIEPKIERIASVGPDKYGESSTSLGQKGGFMVKFSDKDRPIPIGNLGDGIWRLLAIILAIISCKDGVFLVDEIDSGLHHTAMSEMWQLIWKIAKTLNVQVFATTHSNDCWRSLADVIREEKLTGENGSNEIRIHRIERSKNLSVVFIEPEIVIASREEIEVR
ncbi:MAG: AAA family ATPase [Cyanobacteriota bacterium]|nr:AAA family ATPase [Cyanobacteriota bacterium]